MRFNPAEAEEWFRSCLANLFNSQFNGFNPAEAEEWFRRISSKLSSLFKYGVSIQPKPKNGLEGKMQ